MSHIALFSHAEHSAYQGDLLGTVSLCTPDAQERTMSSQQCLQSTARTDVSQLHAIPAQCACVPSLPQPSHITCIETHSSVHTSK